MFDTVKNAEKDQNAGPEAKVVTIYNHLPITIDMLHLCVKMGKIRVP